MFDVDKGLIHMAFMNDDIYVKKSLITLNRQKNLYYEIKKAGCKAVFQITQNDQGYVFTCLDDAAKEIYRERIPGKKTFFSKFTWLRTDSAEDADSGGASFFVFEKEKRKELFDVLSLIMNQTKNTAFVFSMDTMYSFRQSKHIVDFFLEQANRNYERKNLVIVVSDASCEASFDMLTDENGFFQTDVFPSIRKICQEYENPRLYECLDREMKGQIAYFNYMTKENLNNLVTLEMIKKEDAPEAIHKIGDYTDFIWLAVHSPSFLKQITVQTEKMKVLGQTGYRYCEIQKLLRQADFCQEMDKLIGKLRKNVRGNPSLMDLVKQSGMVLNRQPFLSWNNPVLGKMDDIILPGKTESGKQNPENWLQEIRQQCQEPFVVTDKEKQKKINQAVDDYLNVAINSSHTGDTERLELALEAMQFCLEECNKPRYTADSEKGMTEDHAEKDSHLAILEHYSQALQEAEAIFEQKKLQKEYRKELNESYRGQKERQELLDQLMHESGLQETQLMNSANPIAVRCLSLQKTLVDTQKNIKVINGLLQNIAMNLHSHEQTIQMIKNTIAAIKNSKYSYNNDQLELYSNTIRTAMETEKNRQKEYENIMENLQNSMYMDETVNRFLKTMEDEDELSSLMNEN